MDKRNNSNEAQHPVDSLETIRSHVVDRNGDFIEPNTPNDVFDILTVILNGSRPVPMSKHLRMVDIGMVGHYLNTLEDMLPRTIPESRRIMEDKDKIISSAQRHAKSICDDAENHARIIMDDADDCAKAIKAEARAEADRILDEARKDARLMVDKSEVRRIAEDEAGKMMANARKNASDTVNNSHTYVDRMLSDLEDFLKIKLGDVQMTRSNISGNRE